MMMILPVGGFLTLGVLIAVVQYFLNGRKKGAGDK
jgi:Na+-translocating ferredoxin:NAD+ oxidoreductase RnfE subunit